MITLYLISRKDIIPEKSEYYLSFCDSLRREKVLKYKSSEDKQRSIAAGLLIQYAYARYQQEQKRLHINPCELQYNEDGKPYVLGEESFYFNLSHAQDYVVLAVSAHRVGVDVEQIVTNKDVGKLADRFFHKKEKDKMLSIEDTYERNDYFTKTWTIKESYIKYLGVGLRYGMDSFFASNGIIEDYKQEKEKVSVHSDKIEDYWISVSCREIQDIIDVKKCTIQEIMNCIHTYFL